MWTPPKMVPLNLEKLLKSEIFLVELAPNLFSRGKKNLASMWEILISAIWIKILHLWPWPKALDLRWGYRNTPRNMISKFKSFIFFGLAPTSLHQIITAVVTPSTCQSHVVWFPHLWTRPQDTADIGLELSTYLEMATFIFFLVKDYHLLKELILIPATSHPDAWFWFN